MNLVPPSTRSGTNLFLTENATAELLHLSRRTLQGWRAQGSGPPYIKIEGTIRYYRPAVLDWISSRAVHPKDPANG